jgi:hypothetical protein
VPTDQRWYAGRDAVPAVTCAVGNCIDINTYLVSALRAAGYEAAYITCYFFPKPEQDLPNAMHCWVRTRCDGLVEDWDIAHFKKLGDGVVRAGLNPLPGARWALAYGRTHTYVWNGMQLDVTTPSEPMWITAKGKVVWSKQRPIVTLERGD